MDALPEAERANAQAINLNLHALKRCVNTFEAALKLFDFSAPTPDRPDRHSMPHEVYQIAQKDWMDRIQLATEWMRIAAKSGAMSIYEFHRIEQAIDNMIARCPTIEAAIDKNARKNASRLFADAFPNFADIRGIAAHGWENSATPEKVLKNALKDFGSVLISEGLHGRDYVNSFEGKMISYSVSQDTLDRLSAVLAQRYLTFEGIAQTTAAQIFGQPRQTASPPLKG
jgi:hypothetical protein